MVGWERLLQPLRSEAGKRFERSAIGLFSSSYHSKAKKVLGEVPSFQNSLISKDSCVTSSLYRYLQQLRFTGSRKLLADSSGTAPISSPLSPALAISSGETENVKAVSKPATVQAILKGIKQSTKKVNLVAALVRGMRVEDALLQLQVTVKRASKAVYQVIHSARANATHNYGFDPDRLLVAEAFVGKGFCQKRVSYHAKGRSGIKIKPECRLTVVLREITEEEEAKIAKLKVNNFRKLSKRERRLVPHKLIETTPVWNRKNRPNNNNYNNNDDLRRSSDAMAL